MENKKCPRTKILLKELVKDWDSLNMAFKSLIIIGIVLFISVIIIAIISDGGSGLKNSIEVVFRSTLASVFGFLLSSNIKTKSKNKDIKLKQIEDELKQIEDELKQIDINIDIKDENCENKSKEYSYDDGNLVQIIIALSICLISIFTIGFLFLSNNVQNIPAVSQIRDLMCSSIGFLLGESSKKEKD